MGKKENIQDFADQLKNFLPLVDMFMQYEIEDLKEWVENMKENAHIQESIGVMFDMDALEKADIKRLQANIFEKLIKLIEARKEQIQKESKFKKGLGDRAKISRMLGF